MSKAKAFYEGGISGLKHAALREDGTMFMRFQIRTPRGYRWGPWKFYGHFIEIPAEYNGMRRSDHINSTYVKPDGSIRARLP